MLCFPRQNAAPHRHVSVFLEYPEASFTPHHLSPKASFKLIIKNFKDTSKDLVKVAEHRFESSVPDWGFGQVLPLSEITKESGYLREDGALVIRAEVALVNPPVGSYPASVVPDTLSGLAGLSTDLLALLDNPGATADLVIIATGPVPVAAEGAGPSSQQQGDGTGEGGGASSTGPTSRRFEVHRAILAARCPYFRTLFSSGLCDSGARELTLPDTDPDALAVLLRFMYGGKLVLGSREQARSCLALADRLLLPGAAAALRKHLAATTSASTVLADLLCATSLAAGHEQLLDKLLERYAGVAEDVAEEELEQLASKHPALMVQLHKALCRAAGVAKQGST